jgi:hypothetical protein
MESRGLVLPRTSLIMSLLKGIGVVCFYLFMYDLFNDAINSSDFTLLI